MLSAALVASQSLASPIEVVCDAEARAIAVLGEAEPPGADSARKLDPHVRFIEIRVLLEQVSLRSHQHHPNPKCTYREGEEHQIILRVPGCWNSPIRAESDLPLTYRAFVVFEILRKAGAPVFWSVRCPDS